MRYRKPGQVTEGLWYLGRPESGFYLLEGTESSLIISGGTSYIINDVLEQTRRFNIDLARAAGLIILHTHFDHVGTVPYLKRRWPALNLYGSARAWEILANGKYLDVMNSLGRNVMIKTGKEGRYSGLDIDWRDDIRGTALRDGDTLSVGNHVVEILETPGHSSCSISAYIPSLKAVFPSDGGGIPYSEHTIITYGNSNYTKFQESLKKLGRLETDYVCADHHGYITGKEAREFNARAQEAAANLRKEMETLYLEMGDVDAAAGELYRRRYAGKAFYFLDEEIITDICRQMVRHVSGAMQG